MSLIPLNPLLITDPDIRRLWKILELLRLLDREVPAQVLTTFLFIASHDGCNTKTLTNSVGLTASSISRCTDWLSDYHRLGKPGMGLIVKKKDVMDQRGRLLYLTPKGQQLINQIKGILND